MHEDEENAKMVEDHDVVRASYPGMLVKLNERKR